MIYVSISTIPQRLKNIEESVESLLKQTLKPDKIFINIPYKYKRFSRMKLSMINKYQNLIIKLLK